MNLHKHVEVAITTDPGKEHPRNRDRDTVPQKAPFNEQLGPSSKVWFKVRDDLNFEAFVDGEGI